MCRSGRRICLQLEVYGLRLNNGCNFSDNEIYRNTTTGNRKQRKSSGYVCRCPVNALAKGELRVGFGLIHITHLNYPL
jgi:hypothetical protein